MRCTIAMASWIAPMIVGASAAIAQQPVQQGSPKDTVKKLAAVSIVATPSGRDQTRGANAIGKTRLKERAAGTSALKAIEKLPGVNTQSSDPWGSLRMGEQHHHSRVRNTADRPDVRRSSARRHELWQLQRARDRTRRRRGESRRRVEVAQGSGAIGTSSANNLGGVVQYASDAPRGTQAFTLRQTVGAANTYRTTGRWDTGLHTFGDNGISSYLSFTRQDNDKWKGAGDPASPSFSGILGSHGLFRTWGRVAGTGEREIRRLHRRATRSPGTTRSTTAGADYVDFSLARWEKSGRMWDEFTNWNDAKAYATSTDQQDEAYWKSSLGARRDHLAYVRDDIALGEHTHAHHAAVPARGQGQRRLDRAELRGDVEPRSAVLPRDPVQQRSLGREREARDEVRRQPARGRPVVREQRRRT